MDVQYWLGIWNFRDGRTTCVSGTCKLKSARDESGVQHFISVCVCVCVCIENGEVESMSGLTICKTINQSIYQTIAICLSGPKAASGFIL